MGVYTNLEGAETVIAIEDATRERERDRERVCVCPGNWREKKGAEEFYLWRRNHGLSFRSVSWVISVSSAWVLPPLLRG